MENKKLKIWDIVWPILIYIGISIFFGFIAVIIEEIILNAGYVVHTGGGGTTIIGGKMINRTTLTLIAQILSQVTSAIIFILVYKKLKTKKPNKINKIKVFSGISTVLFFSISFSLFTDILNKINLIKVDNQTNLVTNIASVGNPFLVFISFVILAPIVEELLFRGIILNKLKIKYSSMKSIVISALLFGLIHMAIIQGIGAFLIGIAIGMLYEKTKSLKICMLAHAINNLVAVIGIQLLNFNQNLVFEIIILIMVIPLTINFLKTYKVAK